MSKMIRGLTVGLLALLLLGVGPVAAWAANWVPWDGFHITSSYNCSVRKAYIAKTYQIPLKALRCTRYSTTCGGSNYYWLLEVDSDQTIVASFKPEASQAVPALAAC